MKELQLGWIDFSKEQRNKVIRVINLLSEPEAVDELGVGIIRDGFANIFFPGTSTIQTRAKYFLLAPYILNELEHKKGMNADRMIKTLYEEELNLIEVLKKSGENGVIGERSGKKLKRKPSDIYWNGIRTYGIFTGGKMSLYNYAKVSCLLKDKQQKLKDQVNLKSKDDEVDGDDTDVVSGEFNGFWKLPDYSDKWKEDLSIRLTYTEAEFLKNQILLTCPDSLLGYVLKNNYTDFLMFENFDDIEGMMNILPDNIKKDYILAKEFADFIYGAHLRYNVLLSKGEDYNVNAEWELWYSQMKKYAEINLEDIFNRLNIKNVKLKNFLFDCKEAMLKDDIDRFDETIIRREISIKGEKRSKVRNNEFEYEGWTGIGKLQYRLRNGQNVIRDIYEGLGDKDA
jgi:hypothetical protein